MDLRSRVSNPDFRPCAESSIAEFQAFSLASTDHWAWRINGHHLLAQATVVGDQISGAPHFFGAEPATVLDGPHTACAPCRGRRTWRES